ncbi:MAG: hypothetical protein EXS10_04120 [Phycisphaerales bacterium]|nr:hypothetical protein [Phycisphaerales bacterium]
MHSTISTTLSIGLLVCTFTACNTAPQTASDRRVLDADVHAFIVRLKERDPSIAKYFDTAAGYVVYPSISKGGLIIGGAFGRGEVFSKDGTRIGYSDLTQGSIGAQIGGQSFGEIIFFETAESLSHFKEGDFVFAATASAVAVSAGAAAEAKYDHGVIAFLTQPKGLMAEASVGGQQLSYCSVADVE